MRGRPEPGIGRSCRAIGPLVTMNASIRQLDSDTVLVHVADEPPAVGCVELQEALHTAEQLEKPGLIVDLTELSQTNGDVVATLNACQARALEAGRWLLVVPPASPRT